MSTHIPHNCIVSCAGAAGFPHSISNSDEDFVSCIISGRVSLAVFVWLQMPSHEQTGTVKNATRFERIGVVLS